MTRKEVESRLPALRKHFGNENINLKSADARLGSRYALVTEWPSGGISVLYGYSPLREIDSFIDGVLGAEEFKRRIQPMKGVTI